ncbi:subunit 17 of mediator complex-domain-containing protein [Flagelloscypha sp. PMI_526]|nr:subunit 17 of mediator complex-domain-containing protein [Flagelloscypha sp. PMI_526]
MTSLSQPLPNERLKLSLERPWKDDFGHALPSLLDIGPDSELVYEPKQTPSQVLGENLQRIFQERGIDFFEKYNEKIVTDKPDEKMDDAQDAEVQDEESTNEEETEEVMTTDELLQLRQDSLPQIYTALGAKASLSIPAQQNESKSNMSFTKVDKVPPIASVSAFNAQLALGEKDQSLRKAADIFKEAATALEQRHLKSESYWLDALKLRRANWGLIPAPLPFGNANVRGAGSLSKDILVSFGLEESPAVFKQRAVALMPTYTSAQTSRIKIPARTNTRLQVSLLNGKSTSSVLSTHAVATFAPTTGESPLEGDLVQAQSEVVDAEIFSILVAEASTLPTSSTRVSERLVAVEVTDDVELRFELVDSDTPTLAGTGPRSKQCNLVYHTLRLLLLRMHAIQSLAHNPHQTLQQSSNADFRPQVLAPLTSLLLYQSFSTTIYNILSSTVSTLLSVGVEGSLRWTPISEMGETLLDSILSPLASDNNVGGSAILRLASTHTLRLTLNAPSTLTAHLPQATLQIGSIGMLHQLMDDEVCAALLRGICEVGERVFDEACDSADEGSWFVDLNECVGRWEGGVM